MLRFDHVTVQFDGEDVLADVSFEAVESESRVILGAAGSGKTVLLKTALGLVKPDRGKVFAFGRDLTTMSERELFDIRSKIGMLFQESALFDSLTIEENVAYPLLNQRSIQCPPERGAPAGGAGAGVRGTGRQRWRNFRASFRAACGAAPPSRARW